MQVKNFFDQGTSTLSYVIWDERTGDAAIIDPVWDFDQPSSTASRQSLNEVLTFVKGLRLNVVFALETHAHADHLSSSQLVKEMFPKAQVAIGARIQEVQKVFKDVFHLPAWFKTDGSQFDRLFADNEEFKIGSSSVRVLFSPGHTPACASYLVGDMVFTGDALFMPDYGTGRCDFPSGSAAALYDSITKRLYALPEATRVFVGHDYQPGGRDVRWETTIGDEKRSNVQLNGKTTREEFIKFRTTRDRTLSAPKLLLPSVQININAGRLPPPEANGQHYLKLPIRLEP